MVSVIMPTYNQAAFVQQAMTSVLRQSYGDLELIIIDDGSEDETATIINNFHDARIRYYRVEHCGSLGRLRNTGVGKASGTFIAFIDSDDTWDEDKLERQLGLMEQNPGAGFCICDVRTLRAGVIEKQHTYDKYQVAEVTDLFRLLKKNETWVFPSTLLLRKTELKKTGLFNEAMHSPDFDFVMRLAYHSPAMVLYESLVTRRLHDNNMSSRLGTTALVEMIQTFEDLYRMRMLNKGAVNYAKWSANFRLGEYDRRSRNFHSARRRYLSAARYRPFQWRNYLRLLQSL